MTDRYCIHCFANVEIKSWIERHAEPGFCEFCGKHTTQTVDTELFCEALLQCVYTQYSTPDEDGMSYNSREGGWMGETFDSDVPLDALCLETDDEARLAPIEAFLENHSWLWCDADHRNFNPEEQALSDWQQFCSLTKHRVRYVFLQEEQEGNTEHHGQSYHVREILRDIGRAIYENDMVVNLAAGTLLYRVRPNRKKTPYNTLAQLAGPPPEAALYANRMSPAGISMLYAAFDQDTAIAETLRDPTSFTVGEFKLSRDIAVVDFSRVPARQSILLSLLPQGTNTFSQAQRHQINFLHQFVHDLSKPVDKDRTEHIEYVPTQIVTEYFRHLYAREHDETQSIMGVVYTSAQSANHGKNIVLFVDAIDPNAMLPNKRDASHFLDLARATLIGVGEENVG